MGSKTFLRNSLLAAVITFSCTILHAHEGRGGEQRPGGGQRGGQHSQEMKHQGQGQMYHRSGSGEKWQQGDQTHIYVAPNGGQQQTYPYPDPYENPLYDSEAQQLQQQ